jgi:hypothetical protein
MTKNIRYAINEAFGHRFWDDQNMYKDRSGAQLVVTKPEFEISEFDNLDEISEDTIQNEDQETADSQA